MVRNNNNIPPYGEEITIEQPTIQELQEQVEEKQRNNPASNQEKNSPNSPSQENNNPNSEQPTNQDNSSPIQNPISNNQNNNSENHNPPSLNLTPEVLSKFQSIPNLSTKEKVENL